MSQKHCHLPNPITLMASVLESWYVPLALIYMFNRLRLPQSSFGFGQVGGTALILRRARFSALLNHLPTWLTGVRMKLALDKLIGPRAHESLWLVRLSTPRRVVVIMFQFLCVYIKRLSSIHVGLGSSPTTSQASTYKLRSVIPEPPQTPTPSQSHTQLNLGCYRGARS
jgi:hypothetical protein